MKSRTIAEIMFDEGFNSSAVEVYEGNCMIAGSKNLLIDGGAYDSYGVASLWDACTNQSAGSYDRNGLGCPDSNVVFNSDEVKISRTGFAAPVCLTDSFQRSDSGTNIWMMNASTAGAAPASITQRHEFCVTLK